MTHDDICEIKSVRPEIISTISNKMKEEDIFRNTSELFKILGDYNRLRIISALQYGEMCVCELSLLLDMSQSSISHQLRHLRNRNIVKFRKEQKQTFYSLNDEEIVKLIEKGEAYAKK